MTADNKATQPTSLVEAMNNAVKLRMIAVLLTMLVTSVVNFARILISEDQSFSDEPVAVPTGVMALMLYHAGILVWLYRKRDNNRPLPDAWIYGNALLEALFPTVLALLIATHGDYTARQAVLGPLSHLYPIFIVLSIMHVRFSVSALSGIVASAGMMILIYTDRSVHLDTEQLPRSLEYFSAILVLAAGLASGFVARRTRHYLETAARQAEARARAERDLQTAALIQQSLMPSTPPLVPGFEIFGWNRSADETGGDYYDWVALDDGRFAICIADVTGHGLGPAMITCFCRAYARTALRVESRVAAALNRLNDELVHDLGDGRFVTFAAVIITPGMHEVLSTSAGHGPLLLYRGADDSIERFGADALPLGVYSSDDEVEAVTHTLETGDVFLLLTDGFFEWASPSGEQYGTTRLAESLARHGSKAPDQLVAALLADLEAFAQGTEQPDDLTAVVIRRTETDVAQESRP
ncbi:MAG: PP2C family protein-serine/threonine phosphatase [Planctomycetota bacterium]